MHESGRDQSAARPSRLRAVTYNRCSTEEERQKDALAKQVQEARRCVAEQGWELTDIYVEAKSGTTSKGRGEYNRLYQDLERDKYDIIVIKSQDRLMRNTRDWYLFLDRMLRYGKRLYIYLERKFYTPDDALITGIKAILAEEFSRELSKKINNAHRNRQREGQSFVLTNQTYGYRKLPGKGIVIEEREAEMIRLLFQLSADGYGTHSCARLLYEKGFRNRAGKMPGPSALRKILRNPLYKGDVVQNRQHYDFDRKQLCANPESEWIIHKNAVPAIVTEELFARANRAMDERCCGGNRTGKGNTGEEAQEGSLSGKYIFTGKLVCGLCGQPYYRIVRYRKNGEKIVEWKCSNYLQNGRKKETMQKKRNRKTERGEEAGCDNLHLPEEKLLRQLEKAFKEKQLQGFLEAEKEKALIGKTMAILEEALGDTACCVKTVKLEQELSRYLRQRELLLEKLLDGIISDGEYTRKNRELQEKTERIQMQLEESTPKSGPPKETPGTEPESAQKRLARIRKTLEETVVEQAEAMTMMEKLRKIKVFPDGLEIFLQGQENGGEGKINPI